MRISDWSSDVCSSDLLALRHRETFPRHGDAQRKGAAGHPLASVAMAGAGQHRRRIDAETNGSAPAPAVEGKWRDSHQRCPSGRAPICAGRRSRTDLQGVVSVKSVSITLDRVGGRYMKKKK